ncbi:diguanylate cyclase [Aminobacter aganoensis]|uniref:diguanylate cyclase n=1 Tax=Aminobacter aganoensis TaxID=83264 RepID=A0A7X0F3V0_9HYPH|nr:MULTISPECIES: GGDEF domain-containing protein [Aminobacter]KQU69939.1 diguanylate cyclase [Aminobacter sp. DSM 101952]MBB6352570.1 diguanylate cyclase (GGDEF)-like protein [Aminobacter aganoensis]
MTGALLLILQAVIYFVTMAAVFRARHQFGIGIFVCVLGVMHFLETYLAAVFFVQLPFGLISPGSTVMFSGKLMMFLLLYIKEDAETVRQPIYGLLVGNCLMVVLALILRLYGGVAELPGYRPDLTFLDDMGILMIWGTALLFLDSIALILIYEKLGQRIANTLFRRIFLSAAIVLTIDQLMFFIGLHLVSGVPVSALYGGWIAKMAVAALYSALLVGYLRYIETKPTLAGPEPLLQVFDRLTFRHRYEDLLQKTGKDMLTGTSDRGQFEALAQSLIDRALAEGKPVSLLMIDIDHFKNINDQHGHVTGDNVLKDVARSLGGSLRSGDRLFRYGGEEFVAICHDLDRADAATLAERLRANVEATTFVEAGVRATVSIGVTTADGGPVSTERMIRDADARLYSAKRQGRNRVESAPAG